MDDKNDKNYLDLIMSQLGQILRFKLMIVFVQIFVKYMLYEKTGRDCSPNGGNFVTSSSLYLQLM